MKERIRKALCSPVNWFTGDEEFCRKSPSQVPVVYFIIILLLVAVLLYVFSLSLFLVKGCLHVFYSEWMEAVRCFLAFLLSVCVFWLVRIAQRRKAIKQHQENSELCANFSQNGKRIEESNNEGVK
jgi:protein-S-isoprenylcysteine O-methyltransferase Ste14